MRFGLIGYGLWGRHHARAIAKAPGGQGGRVLTVGHELRLSTQWGRIKVVIDAGDIGEPMCAVVNLFRFPYRPGAAGWRYRGERVGSWILEELVHHFDFLMWYFERWGDPVSVSAVGNAREGRPSRMADNVAAILRYRGPLYAVLTQTVAAFEYHMAVEIVGTEGAIRSWWSGAIDRTREPVCGLTLRRRGRSEAEPVPLAASGELFELEEELRLVITAFADRRPVVSAEEARKRVIVCLATERSLREGRAIDLLF